MFKNNTDKSAWVGEVFSLIDPSLKAKEGAFLESEANTIIKEVIRSSPHSALLGSTSSLEAEVYHWMSYMIHTDTERTTPRFNPKECTTFLNKSLLRKSYFVGTEYTLADIVIYNLLQKFNGVFMSTDGIPELKRWFDHVQHKVLGTKISQKQSDPTFFPAMFIDASTVASPVAPPPPSVDTAPTPPAAPVKDEKAAAGNKKAEKKEKKKEAAPAAAAAPAEKELDPNMLNIKAGLIVKCWNHPESDK
jgi:hypothetical protein